jgi:UDP-N-acetylmuramate dehydrogenase
MLNIEQDKLLAPWTTFKIGGLAKYFVEVFDERGLLQAVEFAKAKNLPVFVLGGGSNILVSDEGFSGLVILNRIKGVEVDANTGIVRAGAGEVWDYLVEKSVEANLAGIECLSGIPGTVGGAVVQNIGAYGQTFGDVVAEIEALNIETLKSEKLSAAEAKFAYRNSLFKENPGTYVITYVRIKLIPHGEPTLVYHDLAAYFQGKLATLPSVRGAVFEIRARKGMVISDRFESFQSAGSYFKNPVVEKIHFDRIRTDLSFEAPKSPWYWEMSDGRVKISAAHLISKAGFPKGYQEGEAGISPKHNQSIINYGQASASEVYGLAQKIKKAVDEKYGIPLEEEVLMVGNFEASAN